MNDSPTLGIRAATRKGRPALLTPEQIDIIRKVEPTYGHVKKLAHQYRTHRATIRAIQGSTWPNIPGPAPKLTQEQIDVVRAAVRYTGYRKRLAAEFNVGLHTIDRARSGQYGHRLTLAMNYSKSLVAPC